MTEQLYKKLQSISNLPPIKYNEQLIRNLSQQLINEMQLFDEHMPQGEKQLIKYVCLEKIRLVNYDLILKSKTNDYTFETYQLDDVIKNVITACEVVLCKTHIKIGIQQIINISGKISLKLFIDNIMMIIRILCENDKSATIRFKLKSKNSVIVLLTETDICKQKALAEDSIEVLRKISELFCGRTLISYKKSKIIVAQSFKLGSKNLHALKKSPGYVELLLNKQSSVYVNLNGIY